MSKERPESIYAPREQLRYAAVLEWGTRIGFALLVASFLAYVFEWLPAHVSHDQLPQLWSRPVGTYLEHTGIPTGWGWLSLVVKGDIVNLVGIGILSGVSMLCLVAVIPLYVARKDRVYLAICVLEIMVLMLAASGILTAGH